MLTSPNYPEPYPSDLFLVQKIQVPEGNTIWLRFTDFDCEPENDYVEITEQEGATKIGEFNRDQGLSEADWRRQIVSSTNNVEVQFSTDGSVSGRGWSLEWGKYSICISHSIYQYI